MRDNLTQFLPDLYQYRLKEDLKKGITHKDPRARLGALSEDIEDQIQSFAKEYSHYQEMLKNKKAEKIKIKREHREEVKNHHDRRLYKKTKKEKLKKKTEDFWRGLKA